MQRTPQAPDCYLPALLEDEDGVAHGNDWAEGFLRGVALNPACWHGLIDSEEHGGAILPMMILAHENDPDPELRSPAIQAQGREELLQQMVAGVHRIHAYFAAERQMAALALGGHALAPVRREGPKIGRNDPCPCGSGTKYKFCCGAAPTRLH